jgi:Heavy-metal-associated domain
MHVYKVLNCFPLTYIGVTSFQVDLKNKKVVVTGDITPGEVLESISKVMKFAELLVAPKPTINEVTNANYGLISL